MKSGIYIIWCKPNNKVYVGRSANIKVRIGQHRSLLRAQMHNNQALQSDYDEYGLENFVFGIVEYCSEEMLDGREHHWSTVFDCSDLEFGYNVSPVKDPGLAMNPYPIISPEEILNKRSKE